MAQIDLPSIRDLRPDASLEEKYLALYDAYFMLTKKLTHLLSCLDSENVTELDANITNIKNLVAEAIITQTLVTQTLYAEKGYIAELTVDQLDTSAKVQNYLDEDTGDVNYIKIYEQHIEFITAKVKFEEDEITPLAPVQAEDRFGRPLYWADEEHKAVQFDPNDDPVMIYQYDELMKAKLTFILDPITTNYEVEFTLGAGVGNTEHPDRGKAFIRKVTNGLEIEYITPSGVSRKIALTDDGLDFGSGTIAGMPRIFVQPNQPSDEESQVGDIWIDSDDTSLEDILAEYEAGTL